MFFKFIDRIGNILNLLTVEKKLANSILVALVRIFQLLLKIGGPQIEFLMVSLIAFEGGAPWRIFWRHRRNWKINLAVLESEFSEKFENFSTKKFYNLFCRDFHADHFDILFDRYPMLLPVIICEILSKSENLRFRIEFFFSNFSKN